MGLSEHIRKQQSDFDGWNSYVSPQIKPSKYWRNHTSSSKPPCIGRTWCHRRNVYSNLPDLERLGDWWFLQPPDPWYNESSLTRRNYIAGYMTTGVMVLVQLWEKKESRPKTAKSLNQVVGYSTQQTCGYQTTLETEAKLNKTWLLRLIQLKCWTHIVLSSFTRPRSRIHHTQKVPFSLQFLHLNTLCIRMSAITCFESQLKYTLWKKIM